VQKVPGGGFQRFGPQQRPAGVAVPFRGRQQPGGVLVDQAAAVQCVRLPVRDLRSGGEPGGMACEGGRGGQVAGLDGEADGVRQQVLDLLGFFRIALERLGQRGERLRQCAGVLVIQAAGESK